MSESPKGFISAPTLEQLKPTPEEQEKLRHLIEWQRQSERSHYLFGPSLCCPHCHVQNNPNNSHCWQCGKAARAESDQTPIRI